jgi:trimeric autotransporter adhesin
MAKIRDGAKRITRRGKARAVLTGTGRRNTLRGTGSADTLSGLGGSDILRGLGGNDTLIGGAGNDTLEGGRGRDILRGGTSNDTYIVDNPGDRVIERPNQGTDTVRASISYRLGNNVENVTLTGNGNISGTGNALNNDIIGNAGNNNLDGGAGNDTISGGDGNDTISGGDGDDNLDSGAGNDTISGGDGNDTISGGDGDDNLDGGAGNDTISGGDGNDTISGGDGNDIINGGAGNDTINGGAGIDTISGDDGNDVINGGDGNDVIIGGNGDDFLQGGNGNDFLQGDAGSDFLDGGLGLDTLVGGTGDDTYIVDDSADVIVENVGEGTDSVFASASYVLSDNLENLILTGVADIAGTGNALDNTITGNDGNNILDGGAGNDVVIGGLGNDTIFGGLGDDILSGGDGNDTLTGGDGNDYLDGGAGADFMNGGNGNDTYVIDNPGDVVSEAGGSGVDTVISAFSTTLSADIENLTLLGTANLNGTGNSSANTIIGNAGSNNLTGGAGDDYLDGGAGADTLTGGTGNDIYVVDNVGDRVIEFFGEGTDTVLSSINYTLGDNVENLTLLGGANLRGFGNSLDNIITGNAGDNILIGGDGNDVLVGGAGNDILDGGLGADTLVGGLGNDSYIINDPNDTVSEDVGGGTDTIISSITYNLGANVENLVLTAGAGDINGSGNDLNNTITGNEGNNVLSGGAGNDVLIGGAGNDTLDGGAGVDTLSGGAGDDTYFVDDSGDVIVENVGEGNDVVNSTATFYSLSANLETLNLLGTANLSGTGNSGNNTINGNVGNNILDGGAGNDVLIGGAGNDVLAGGDGNDVLDGGTGSDTMRGGLGNDTYFVDSITDSAIDEVNGGLDVVFSSVSFTLTDISNIENLILTGSANINGGGNNLNNSITGNAGNNTLIGNAGNDFLDGGLGTDTLIGGSGDDTYVINDSADTIIELAGEGTDTVISSSSYTLSSNLENLILSAGAGSINGTGNELNNTITGNEGDNILDGGAGADRLVGGLGNDTYLVDNIGDVVVEDAGAGIDTVQSRVNYTLGNNIENLILVLGAGNINGVGNAVDNTIIGNEGNNSISGAAGNDVLIGGAGDDILDGGIGTDIMTGGAGNDTYVVDNIGDVVNESNPAEGTADTVRSGINYTLGVNIENLELTGSAIIGTGNSSNNTITGNAVDNILDGGAGADLLIGGLGNDTYLVDPGDTIREDLNAGIDSVNATFSYSLGANLENLNLIGVGNLNGFGNALSNIITGNDGNNLLDGLGGADRLTGGLGNDTYVVDNVGDIVVEDTSGGIDTVQSSITYSLEANLENLALLGANNINGTGNSVNNTITGNDGSNILDGGGGTDRLIGGLGDDTYIVDSSDDIVIEATEGGGVDTVQSSVTYSLGANVENLVLTGTDSVDGTGNGLNNTITGNSGNNVLNGGAGDDKLIGGLGDDIYFVDSTGDRILENADQGIDSVFSTVNFSLGDNLENLTLQPGAGNINGTGNSLNNTIVGNEGDNILDGKGGVDRLIGGNGNDVYIIDTLGALAVETSATGGIDRVESSTSYTLGDNLENLTLTGTADIIGAGNNLDNTIVGNSGNNILDGEAGNDTLIGGKGNDTYILDSLGDTVTEIIGGGIDTILSGVTFSLGANVENLTLTGTANINGFGNDLSNTIIGNSGSNTLMGMADNDVITGGDGNDYLDGGTGSDILNGGLGNDIYIIDDIGDVINDAGGIDTVISGISYTLEDSLENLTLTGSATVGLGNSLNNIIIGNALDNTLTGLAGNDTLTGGAGNDYLYGGTGADTMTGGLGNDFYSVDNVGDIITENPGEGTDTVSSSISYSLGANLENLNLEEGAAIDGTGNTLNNIINGNSFSNTLDGGAGADTLNGGGGTGGDTYILDNLGDVINNAGTGIDQVLSFVSVTLGANLDNLTLLGTAAIGIGNELNNTIIGNDSDNFLDGGVGADDLSGGAGNDSYIVDNLGDIVTDTGITGIDTVISSVSFTLGANLENLTLVGAAATGTGNALNNTIIGNDNGNTLNGAGGADDLRGGLGNDLYIVDNFGDTVTETGAGIDKVASSVSFTLGALVENLELTGTAVSGVGNDLSNTIDGNSSDNFLDGGTGADLLRGGAGNDTYVVDNFGDIVTEIGSGIDKVISGVSFTLGDNLENLDLTGTAVNGIGNLLNNTINGNNSGNFLNGGVGADVLNGGLGNDTFIVDDLGDRVTDTGGIDIVFSSVNFTLVGSTLENLVLTGSSGINGTGNALNNTITGNIGSNLLTGGLGDDVLDGGGGVDTLVGSQGNDTYFVDNTTDIITEGAGEGRDTVISSATFSLSANVENLTLTGSLDLNATGNVLDNSITGNSGDNILDGGVGADTLIGGAGNDTYSVDITNDVVVENAAEGVADTVISSINYTLGANIESLILTGSLGLSGTGNNLDNTITGNSGNNILDGSVGADVLIGGVGNDTYLVDDSQDLIIENAGEGNDVVLATVSFNLASQGANVEALTLQGSAVSGTGNSLNNYILGNSLNNILSGGDGNDTLDGGGGADTLLGGAGNDNYGVDGNDRVIENANEGIDTVFSSASFSLPDNVENLILTATAGNANGTGNALNNTITGNSGNNILDGGGGGDTLIGGAGNDTYVVDSAGDTIVEAAGSGEDTVFASISYSLGDFLENLVLTGGNIDGTGNIRANTITGSDGNNILDGEAGADLMIGGAGNDTYVVDNPGDRVDESTGLSSDIDTVLSSITYSLGTGLENLTLTGINNINGTGNSANNTITGNSGNNTLDGQGGNDLLIGGAGDDLYVVDASGDQIVELLNSGFDTVNSSVTFSLSANIENLTLTGTSNITGIGNDLANTIVGNSGNNRLIGGGGSDVLVGGAGNDTYEIDATDLIIENPGEGIDTIIANFGINLSNVIYANIENLTISPGTVAVLATGNSLNNTLKANSAGNTLSGLAGTDTLNGGAGDDVLLGGDGNDILTGSFGNDTLNGGAGSDTLTGDEGNDKFVFDSALSIGVDTITDFTGLVDQIVLAAGVFSSLGFAANRVLSNTSTTEFASVANDAAVGSSTAIVEYSEATGNLFYNNQLFAQLSGNPSLSAGDIFIQA